MVVLELLHLKMEATVSEPCDVIRVSESMLKLKEADLVNTAQLLTSLLRP